jgi:predicted nucleotidyltransferase
MLKDLVRSLKRLLRIKHPILSKRRPVTRAGVFGVGMDGLPTGVSAEIVDFVSALPDVLGCHHAELKLFGSFLHNRAHAGSDIDLVVISDAFEGVPWQSRLSSLEKASIGLPRIAAVAVTPYELKSNSYPTVIRTIRASNAPPLWTTI